MLTSNLVRKIEAKLYAWGEFTLAEKHYPDAGVSGVYKGSTVGGGPLSAESPQERWLRERAEDMANAEAIGAVVKTLPEELQTLARLRYVEGNTWEMVARQMFISRTKAYSLRDQLLLSLVYALDLLRIGA